MDSYGKDIAPLNIFENQVIPVEKALSLSIKFIPRWDKTNTKNTSKILAISKTGWIQGFIFKKENLFFLKKIFF